MQTLPIKSDKTTKSSLRHHQQHQVRRVTMATRQHAPQPGRRPATYRDDTSLRDEALRPFRIFPSLGPPPMHRARRRHSSRCSGPCGWARRRIRQHTCIDRESCVVPPGRKRRSDRVTIWGRAPVAKCDAVGSGGSSYGRTGRPPPIDQNLGLVVAVMKQFASDTGANFHYLNP